MSHAIRLTATNKRSLYEEILPQLRSLVADEPDTIANMANISAALKDAFGWLWVGFYRVVDDDLVLGPFQGPLACTRIGPGRGVCGKARADAATVIVDDVNAFPGHIACSSDSRSEIVVPLLRDGRVVAVLDIDSAEPATFDATDRHYLLQIASLL